MTTIKNMKTMRCLLSVFCLGFLVACSQQEAKQEDKKPLVQLETVSVQPVAQTYDFTGTVEPFVENKIAPSGPLRIGKVLVEVGDAVRPGQVVARMDKAQFAQQKAQLDNLKTTYERMKNLYDVGGISKQDLDQAETAMIVARTAVANLDENSDLRSPIGGIVTERNYDSGDMYAALPVIVVQQLNPVKVLINVTEELFPRLQKGMNVELRLDVYPDQVFDGKIHLIYPTIDAKTHTFVTEVVIPNNEMKVRPGMFGRITISLGTLDHVVIPDRAVVKQQGSGERFAYMYNNADSTVVRKVLTLGRRLNNSYEVISGIDEKAQVVVAGQTRLVDGMKVEVQK